MELTYFTNKKYEIGIIAIGLLFLLALTHLLQLDVQSMVYLDSGSYYEAAENVYFYYRGQFVLVYFSCFLFLFSV